MKNTNTDRRKTTRSVQPAGFQRRRIALLAALATAACALMGELLHAVGDAASPRRYGDPAWDAVPRPTDPGAAAPFGPTEPHLPELGGGRPAAWGAGPPA